MPYIPRKLAPSGLINSDMVPRAPLKSTADKPPLPYLGSGKGEANPAAGSPGKEKMISRLSMRDWDVDPVKVLKLLTNKELTIDEYSRMVSKSS